MSDDRAVPAVEEEPQDWTKPVPDDRRARTRKASADPPMFSGPMVRATGGVQGGRLVDETIATASRRAALQWDRRLWRSDRSSW